MQWEKKVALIYQYYLSRKRLTPYVSTLFTVVFVLMVHILLIVEGFHLFNYLTPFYIAGIKIDSNRLVVLFGIFSILICTFVFKKKNLSRYIFTEAELKIGWRNTMIYSYGVAFLGIFIEFLTGTK